MSTPTPPLPRAVDRPLPADASSRPVSTDPVSINPASIDPVSADLAATRSAADRVGVRRRAGADVRGRQWLRGAVAMAAAATMALVPVTATGYPGSGRVDGDVVVHDPSMIRTPSGQYLLYSTGDRLQARTSDDRVTFRRAGSAFRTAPLWWRTYSPERDPWAPDVSYHGGRYLMYYTVSTFGSNQSAIGLATSSTGQPGTWADQGVVYRSNRLSTFNAIDPNLFVDDDGSWWLTFGSHWSGISQIRLDPATGKQHSRDRTRHHLAAYPGSTAIEAPFVVKRGGYYYLFASYDRCCAGTDSTYNIRVGRSTSVTGPYVDDRGRRMTDGGGTMVLASNGRHIGPGGQSITPDADGDLLVYHYYDAQDRGVPKLGVNLLDWRSGWPRAY